MSAHAFTPLTAEQHERHHLGLFTVRDGDRTTITVHARMLNATNARDVLLRVATELEAGMRSVHIDLSRCDRGIDRHGDEAVRAIRAVVERAGATFTITHRTA